MLAAMLAVAVTLQAEPLKVGATLAYDKVKDVSTMTANLGLCSVGEGNAAGMYFSYSWPGETRGPVKPDADVYLMVYSVSENWTFLRDESMAILADETRIRPRVLDRERQVSFKTPGVPVAEALLYRISFADLSAIGKASTVDVAVGPKRWSLTTPQIDAIGRCIAHLQVDSEGSKRLLKEKEDAERAAVQARADAVAAERTRLEPYRPEFAAAVEKARKALKAVPKKLYATTGEKIKWRTFDREIEPVIKKHGLKQKDVEAILSEYPDFRARNKIQ